MKQSAKTFGYGFSALVLALSGVVISPDVNADTCTITDGASAQSQVDSANLILCQDLSTNLTISGTKTINLRGHTLTGNIRVNDEATLTIVDTTAADADASGTLNTTISLIGSGKVIFDTSNKTTIAANDGAVVKTLADKATEVVTIKGGTFSGATLISNASDENVALTGTGRLVITGGDFTGISKITDSTLFKAKAFATISGGKFAQDPSTYNLGANKSVYEFGSAYVVATKSTVTPTTKTTLSVDNELEQAFRVTNAVEDVTNSLTFTVVDKTTGSSTLNEEVALSDVFSVRSVVNKGENKNSIDDDTIDYHFTAKKAGSYKVTATAIDSASAAAEVTFNVYDFDEENALKNVYFSTNDLGEADITSLVQKYSDLPIASAVSDTPSVAAAAYAGNKVTIDTTGKAAGSAKVTITFDDASNSTATFNVYVLDPEDDVIWAEIKQDDDGNFIAYDDNDVTAGIQNYALDAAWGNPVKITGSGAAAERAVENKVEKDEIKITPNSTSASTTVFTYAADSDAWFYDGDDVLTDEDDIAEYIDEELTQTITVHTYKVNNAALYYRAATTSVTEAKETINVGDTVDVPSGFKVTVKNTGTAQNPEYAATVGNAATIDSTADPMTITSKAAKETGTVVLTASNGTDDKDITVRIDTYAKDKAIEDEVAYVRIDKTSKVAKSTYVSTENSKLSFNSEDVEVVGDNIVFAPTELGKKTVKVTETLNDKEIATSSIEYNTYGIVDADYYVAPGEALEIAVADPYGTVRVTGANSKDGSVFKNYDEKDGKLTLSSDKEDTITIKVSDFLTDSKAIKDNTDNNGGTREIEATITVHVAEVYITSDVEATTVEAGEASDAFEIKATEGTIKTEVTSNVTEDTTDLAKVSLKSVSKTNNTYQIAVAADAKPGDYEMKVNLTDGTNVKASTTIKIRVTKHATITEGVKTITSKLADSMVLDISGAAINDGANAQLYKSNDTLAQQFLFTADEDGLYTITNLRSGKALDVSGGVAANGTNVQQYEKNNTLSQKWEILEDKDGNKMIVSALDSNLVLDVAGGNKKNGANVQVYEMNYTTSQAWTITPAEDAASEVVIPAKKAFTIVSALDGNMALDISGGSTENGANLQLYTANETDAQSFKFVEEGGLYTITNVNSGKVLDVAGAGRSNGTNVQQYEANDTVAQKWIIEANEDGTVSFKSVHSGLYLDVAGGHTKDNTNIHVYKGNGTKAQKFRIVPVAE